MTTIPIIVTILPISSPRILLTELYLIPGLYIDTQQDGIHIWSWICLLFQNTWYHISCWQGSCSLAFSFLCHVNFMGLFSTYEFDYPFVICLSFNISLCSDTSKCPTHLFPFCCFYLSYTPSSLLLIILVSRQDSNWIVVELISDLIVKNLVMFYLVS